MQILLDNYITHFKKRAMERYRMELDCEDIKKINDRIYNHKYIEKFYVGNDRWMLDILIKKKRVRLIYDEKAACVVTLFPRWVLDTSLKDYSHGENYMKELRQKERVGEI